MTTKIKSEKLRTFSINTNEKLSVGTNDVRNLGYGMVKLIYKELEIDKFWNWKTRGRKIKFRTKQMQNSSHEYTAVTIMQTK